MIHSPVCYIFSVDCKRGASRGLLQVPYALLQRPEPSQDVGPHGPLGEIEHLGDLLWTEALLEAEGDGGTVLFRKGGYGGGEAC